MLAKHMLALNAALGTIITYQIIHVIGCTFGANYIHATCQFLKIKESELARKVSYFLPNIRLPII